jgi:hypothetical protein
MLQKVFPETSITGYFDEDTLEKLHNLQTLCNVPNSNLFNIKTSEGKRLLAFITSDY